MVQDAPDLLIEHISGVVHGDRVPTFYGGTYRHPFEEGVFDFETMLKRQEELCHEFERDAGLLGPEAKDHPC
eukprot:310832-Prorocentrum_lima.AAC.1